MTCDLVVVKDLKKYYPINRGVIPRTVGYVKAVDGISLAIPQGKTLGLVGESGCGKTTAGRAILRLIEPTSGSVTFDGRDLLKLSGRDLRRARRRMQIIFQDPYSSLNPRLTVKEIVGEALTLHGLASTRGEKQRIVEETLERVGLSPSYMNRYPHEFSGGQRQRIGIARALALRPRFIVCDEAVSALDVSIQAQILNLLKELQQEMGLTYLFIAHDLTVVKHISDRVAVMYLGEIVEEADTDEIFQNPLHPYTQALLSAIPVPAPRAARKRMELAGDVPTPINPPSGCRFHTRCPLAGPECARTHPELIEVDPGHRVACIKVDEARKMGEIRW